MLVEDIEPEEETAAVVNENEATVEEEVEMQDAEAEATVQEEVAMTEDSNKKEEEAAAIPAEKKTITKVKLFVGSLPTDVSDEDFVSYWKKFDGVLESNVTKKFGTPGKNKGFGFVFCSSKEVAEGLMNHEGGHEIGGKKVRVEMGKQDFAENRFYIKLVEGAEEAKVTFLFLVFSKEKFLLF